MMKESLAMAVLQVAFAIMNIVLKMALDTTMNPYIYVAYRQIFAALLLSPLAYLVERGKRPPITLSVVIQVFMCSMFGSTVNQMTYIVGLKNSSPTIACALVNLLPTITFVLAIIFKQESGRLNTLAGRVKLVGTLVGVGGAIVLSLYKGPILPIGTSRIHLKLPDVGKDLNQTSEGNNLLGSILVIISSSSTAIWLIIQAKFGDKYAAPYSWSAMSLAVGAVECSVFGYIMGTDLRDWKLVPIIRAYSTIYAGVVSSVSICLMSWSIKRKGPLFVSMFNPLLLVTVAILGWLFLREKLYLGTVLGSGLIVIGLYAVLWGKNKEMKPHEQPQQHELQDIT